MPSPPPAEPAEAGRSSVPLAVAVVLPVLDGPLLDGPGLEDVAARRGAGRAERRRLSLRPLLAALGAQRDVRLEVFVVDATAYGDLDGVEGELRAALAAGSAAEHAPAGHAAETAAESAEPSSSGSCFDHELRLLRGRAPSRGAAIRQALAETTAPLVALADARVLPAPERLARQAAVLAARPEIELVTAGVALAADAPPAGTFTEHALERGPLDPPDFAPHAADATASQAFASATLLARRAALAEIDVTCFAPAERALLDAARAAGRLAHLSAPLARARRADLAAAVETAHVDAELLRLAAAANDGERAPEVTVLLAHWRRGDVLMECLAGFARQLVPPGTLEIVVCDDGSGDRASGDRSSGDGGSGDGASGDRSAEWARGLELGVPYTFLEQRNAGACAARNRALPHARGRLVLFVNDDTIPFPDTVAGHLAAHAELGERAAVLGTFEQPAGEREKAVVRLLEGSGFVFGYAGFAAGEELPGVHFYTCNASVPRAALAEIGAFDENLPCFGEDTDWGLRLGAAGYRLVFRPEIRSLHRHVQGFELLRWRQPAVARAHVRLCAKHPEVLDDAWAGIEVEEARRRLREVEPHLAGIEAAARTLSDVRLAALERAGGACAGTAARIGVRLAELVGRLNGHWWRQGFAEELAVKGLSGFPELLARAPLPLPELGGLEEPPRRRELLRAGGAEACWLERVERWLGDPRTRGRALVVWIDPRAVDAAAARTRLEEITAERELDGRRVVAVERELGAVTRVRLFAACDAWVRTGDEEDGLDARAAATAGVCERELGPAGAAATGASREQDSTNATSPSARGTNATSTREASTSASSTNAPSPSGARGSATTSEPHTDTEEVSRGA